MRGVSLNAFTERYRKWCARHGYQFSSAKAAEIHAAAKSKIALVPKSEVSKLLVKEAVAQLNAVSRAVEVYRAEMNRLASQLPEYRTVMEMFGVGPSMGRSSWRRSATSGALPTKSLSFPSPC